MPTDALGLILQLIAGALAGVLVGGVMKEQSLGTAGNLLAGLVGGGIAGQLLHVAYPSLAGGMDLVGHSALLAAGGIGGAVLMVVAGLARNTLGKKSV